MFITGCVLAGIVIIGFIFLVGFIWKKADKIKKYEKWIVPFVIIMIVVGLVAVGLVIAGGIVEIKG